MTPVVIGSLITLATAVGAAGGTIISGWATHRRSTAEAHGIEAKVPVEVDSIAIQGAGAAVLTMEVALRAAQKQITDLQAARQQDAEERARDRKRMAELEAQVDDLRAKVDHAEAALKAAKDAGESLTAELKRLTAEQDQRHSKG